MMDGKQIRSKLIGTDDERAVSPVIGVILMVAITVILAAVIAAFVMDLGSGMNQEAQAGVTTNAENNSVSATWASEGNSDQIVIKAEITSSDGDAADYNLLYDGTTTSGDKSVEATLGSVGDSATIFVESNGGTASPGDEVSVTIQAVAHSSDSTTVVTETTDTVVARAP